MIARYGMSRKFDMVALETVTNQYLSSDASLACSAETAAHIDQEVVATVKAAHEKDVYKRQGVYTAGQLVLNHQAGEAAGTTAYPVAASCVAIDVSQPYHQIKSPVSTGSIYNYCYPSIVNGEVTVIYYTRP